MFKRIAAIALVLSILVGAVVMPASAAVEICYEIESNGKIGRICIPFAVRQVELPLWPYSEYEQQGIGISPVVEAIKEVVGPESAPWAEALLGGDGTPWVLTDIHGKHKLLLDMENEALVPLQMEATR
ncbi:MAG: hypothetical protein AAF702_15795 [Chloroflexota bacterium]